MSLFIVRISCQKCGEAYEKAEGTLYGTYWNPQASN